MAVSASSERVGPRARRSKGDSPPPRWPAARMPSRGTGRCRRRSSPRRPAAPSASTTSCSSSSTSPTGPSQPPPNGSVQTTPLPPELASMVISITQSRTTISQPVVLEPFGDVLTLSCANRRAKAPSHIHPWGKSYHRGLTLHDIAGGGPWGRAPVRWGRLLGHRGRAPSSGEPHGPPTRLGGGVSRLFQPIFSPTRILFFCGRKLNQSEVGGTPPAPCLPPPLPKGSGPAPGWGVPRAALLRGVLPPEGRPRQAHPARGGGRTAARIVAMLWPPPVGQSLGQRPLLRFS